MRYHLCSFRALPFALVLGTWSLTLGGRAILTVFQIQDAESDPLTRTDALCSLVSALHLKLFISR